MKYKISFNGNTYEVEVLQGTAQLMTDYRSIVCEAENLSAKTEAAKTEAVTKADQNAAVAAGNLVTAPMPGLVVAVLVSVGQTIKKGDKIAVVESMKMENEITSSLDGVVVSISAQKGAQVNAGDAIVVLR